MATLSFNIEESEVSKVKAILKALGAKNLKVNEDTQFPIVSLKR